MGNTYIAGMGYMENHPFRKDSEKMARAFNTDAYKDANMVLRWKSNNSVPPQEVLDFWKYVGKKFNMNKAVVTRNKESREFLAKYKQSQSKRPVSNEEMYEMQAAFGKGTVVVDVITGRRTQL